MDKIIVNGDYNSAYNDYDLAMMKLTKPLSLKGRIVCSSVHSLSNIHTTKDIDLKYLLPTGSDIIFSDLLRGNVGLQMSKLFLALHHLFC